MKGITVHDEGLFGLPLKLFDESKITPKYTAYLKKKSQNQEKKSNTGCTLHYLYNLYKSLFVCQWFSFFFLEWHLQDGRLESSRTSFPHENITVKNGLETG